MYWIIFLFILNLNFCIQHSINLQEIVSSEKTLLLHKINNVCEITIETKLGFEIVQISFVTTSPKVELFKGSFDEYYKTFSGVLIDDFEGIRSHRFDVLLENNAQTYTIRFITPNPQVLIFGMHIKYKKMFCNEKWVNSVELNTDMPNISIDNKNMMQILEAQLKNMGKIKSNSLDFNNSCGNTSDNFIQLQMNQLYSKLEKLFEEKFRKLEEQQNEKFEKLFKLLESKSKT